MMGQMTNRTKQQKKNQKHMHYRRWNDRQQVSITYYKHQYSIIKLCVLDAFVRVYKSIL